VVAALLLFGVLWSVRKRLNIAGQLTGLYLVLNGLERFFVEKIRVNSEYSIFGFHPTQAEIISFLMIIAGIYLFSLKTWAKKTSHANSGS
jgi:prolipoprotein diacylglyceryltransferase